ncbi:MAG TPA: SCO6880 family protein, partial [Acidimicrobiales bacterium]|nr:SCO6880 family protein [Acidimicrobiales bacterium]
RRLVRHSRRRRGIERLGRHALEREPTGAGSAAMSESPSYQFAPRQGAGLLGLGLGQLVAIGTGLLGAVVGLLGAHAPGPAVGCLVLGAAVAFVPVAGRPFVAWLSPLAGILGARRGATAPLSERHVLRAGGGIETNEPGLPIRWQLPGLRRLVISSVETPLGEVGVADPSGSGRACSVTFALSGPRFGLADPESQARAIASWGQLLGALARDGAISKLQLTERVAPDDLSTQWRFLAGAEAATPASKATYRDQLESLAGRVLRHEVLLTAILGRSRRTELASSVAAESAHLADQLAAAGFSARPLGAAELAAVLRSILDPDGAGVFDSARPAGRDAGPPCAAALAPRAWRSRFGSVRTDSALHACFETVAMPRLAVGPEWAWPLVLADHPLRRRTLSLHIDLARPEAAIRRAERAVVAQESDEALRSRFGFRSGARQAQAHEAALSRESELAAGFADARFALLVSVSGSSEDELAECCRAVVAGGAKSHVELRRAYGQQARALVATLPLGVRRFTRSSR